MDFPSSKQNAVSSTSKTEVSESNLTEIDIETIEGQQQFLEAAEDVYADALSYEKVAFSNRYVKLNTDERAGSEVFEKMATDMAELQDLVRLCSDVLIPKGEYITDQQFKRLQVLYNKMLDTRNLIIRAYKGFEHETTSVANDDSLSVHAITETKKSSVVVTTEEIFDVNKVETFLVDVKKIVEKTLQHAISITKDLQGKFPESERTMEVKIDLTELLESAKRIKKISNKLKDFVVDVNDLQVSEMMLEKYQQVAEEVRKNVDSINQVLLDKLIKQKAKVGEQEKSVAITPASDPVEHIAESIHTPSESEVLALLKKMNCNQFYTEREHKEIEKLRQDYDLAMEENLPISEVAEKYKDLKEAIDALDSNPRVDDILVRVSNMVEHVGFGAGEDSDLFDLAEAMQKKIILLEDNKGANQEAIIEVYKKLEKLVLRDERHWQTVCGALLPVAGPDGIPQARILRERLIIQRDKHPELHKKPHKKILIDKLVRILADIPKTGLTAEKDIPEIFQLARMIDVMGGMPDDQSSKQGNNLQHKLQDDPVTKSEEAEIQELMIKKRKTMSINSDNRYENEGSIEITVPHKKKNVIQETASVPLIEKVQKHKLPIPPEQIMVVEEQMPEPESRALGSVEQKDAINNIIPKNIAEIKSRKFSQAKNSLVRKYLIDDRYQNFLNKEFGSLDVFEKELRALIARNDAQSVDAFERFLGDEKASAFNFLSTMTMVEVDEFANLKHKEIRAILEQRNIKYESFLVWMDVINDIRSSFNTDDQMTFEELFVRGVVEAEMDLTEDRES